MPDLETQLRYYGVLLDELYPDVQAEEVIEREIPVITMLPTPRPIRDRRSFFGLVAVLGLALLLAGALGFLRTGEQLTNSGQATESTSLVSPTDLGIFEAVRGQIVFNSGEAGGGPIQVVDPSDPASIRDFEFDFPLDVALIPTGWSADGSILAITDEYHGDRYVIDQTGRAQKPQAGGGCCGFADSNWLSPDGARSATAFPGEGTAPGRLAVTDFDDSPSSIVSYELEPFIWASGIVWSPDGSQIALFASRDGGVYEEATIHIVDLESGAIRDLLASEFGHIRNLAWSPDGSQILVIAGEFRNTVAIHLQNPYVHPIATSIYLVNQDGSGLRRIADGHYVAASWSPDGTRIATIDYNVGRRVTVMNADGSEERVVGEMPADELFSGLAWHPIP